MRNVALVPTLEASNGLLLLLLALYLFLLLLLLLIDRKTNFLTLTEEYDNENVHHINDEEGKKTSTDIILMKQIVIVSIT